MMHLFVDVHKDFGTFKLDVSFETESGQITGLLGASGCGKSMTLRCIAGIEKPDRGRIVLDDKVLFDSEQYIDLPPQKRRVGYLFQNYALFPNMTVAQNIAVGVRDKKTRRETVERLIGTLCLEGQEKKYPRQLSGGQQQRVALARILASAPEVLLLDEPFSALDSYLKWQVTAEMEDLLGQFGGPVLFVSHARDEVRQLCTHACIMDQGRTQPMQPVAQLFERPRTLSACLLSGCRNISRARATSDGKIEALDWGAILAPDRLPPSGLTHVAVRSHSVRPAEGPGPNRLPCKVERAVENVFSTTVTLSTPGGSQGFSRLRIELEKGRWSELADKDPLWLELPAGDLLLLTQDA